MNKRASDAAGRQSVGVTSRSPGTHGKRLWLLRSRPDQVHRAAMRGGPSIGIVGAIAGPSLQRVWRGAESIARFFHQRPRLGDLAAIGLENLAQCGLHVGLGRPVEVAHGVGDFGHAVLHVLITRAVIRARTGFHHLHVLGRFGVFGHVGSQAQHHVGEFAHRMIVGRIADVVDLAAGHAVLVFDDFHQRVDAVVNVGKGAFLVTAIDQADGFAAHDMAQELGDDAGAAFLRRKNIVQSGADPVERAEQGVVQAVLLAVTRDDAIHQLFGAGVDPARLVDRAVDQRRVLGIEFGISAHAVHLGGGREHQMLLVFHRSAHDGQIGLEVELENPQRRLHISRRRGDGHQGQDHVAFAHVVLNPLLVDGDVAFEKFETLVGGEVFHAVGVHVHAVHLPVGGGEDAHGEMMTDEAVDAEDEDFFHDCCVASSEICRSFRGMPGWSASHSSTMWSAPPSPVRANSCPSAICRPTVLLSAIRARSDGDAMRARATMKRRPW